MAEVLVSGATGMVGNAILEALLREGRSVRVLARSPERARQTLGEVNRHRQATQSALTATQHALRGVEIVRGDVTDRASLAAAMRGCDTVYHAAGLPEQWLDDEGLFQRVNVEGTHNMVETALEQSLQRFIYTSTIDVFAARAGREFDETRLDPRPKDTAYGRSKQDADSVVARAIERGLPAVFLHPSGLYGPGPESSPGINAMVAELLMGRLPLIPPGSLPLVFSDDVAAGHLLAERKAEVGQRYILSAFSVSVSEVLKQVVEAAGSGKVPYTIPLWAARLAVEAGELQSMITRRAPLLPRNHLHFLQQDLRPLADKAKSQLGWQPQDLGQSIKNTVEFLRVSGRA
ncbi:MAG: NAD-dependent epimerase/dehydratase family protein [Deltaproteobacteria bacterium]